MRKLRSIQVLRAVAALGVVIYHSTKGAGETFGACGVDLFFVISGYIIATVSRGRSPLAFLADRAWRIYPLYFVCLAAFVFLVPISRTACQNAVSLTLAPLGCEPYLIPAWTLQFELVFYLLFAVFMGRASLLVPAIMALAFLAPAITKEGGAGGNYLMVEFLAGVAIAKLPQSERVGAAALVCGAVLFTLAPVDIGLGPMRVLWWGVPAACMVYGALSLERHFAHTAFNLPVRLGDASYSVYLVHFILARAAPMWWMLAIYAQVSAGYLVHLLVERPLMRMRRSAPKEPNAPGGQIAASGIRHAHGVDV